MNRLGPRPVRLPSIRPAGAPAVAEGQAMEREYSPVIDFWFRELTPPQWFMGASPELDDRIRTRFAALVDAARLGALDHWAASPRGRLALIIVLDQFPRHVFRGMPDAYAGDTRAQALAVEGIDANMDEQLTLSERQFFYMPLMHAEDRALQALSLERFEALLEAAEEVVDFASGHRRLVYRFGRFPHRNRILGRSSSPE